eukprot:g23850.t1
MRLRVKMEAEQIAQAHREAERRKTDAEGVRQAHLDQVRFQRHSRRAAAGVEIRSTVEYHCGFCSGWTWSLRNCITLASENAVVTRSRNILQRCRNFANPFPAKHRCVRHQLSHAHRMVPKIVFPAAHNR